jgi:hypothetical protein
VEYTTEQRKKQTKRESEFNGRKRQEQDWKRSEKMVQARRTSQDLWRSTIGQRDKVRKSAYQKKATGRRLVKEEEERTDSPPLPPNPSGCQRGQRQHLIQRVQCGKIRMVLTSDGPRDRNMTVSRRLPVCHRSGSRQAHRG